MWASSANVGDIVGTQLYKVVSRDDNNWGSGEMVCGGLVILFGFINLAFLVEYPKEKGIVILERGHL